jgi:hypothetical protein
MKNDTHDNDNFDPWSSLGLATAMILNRLRNQRVLLELADDKHEKSQRDTGGGSAEKEKEEANREYVDQRLRELAAFEDRARGKRNSGLR